MSWLAAFNPIKQLGFFYILFALLFSSSAIAQQRKPGASKFKRPGVPAGLKNKRPGRRDLKSLSRKGKGKSRKGQFQAGGKAKQKNKKAEGKSAKWKQVDEKENEPTLSADFIKNCQRLKPGVRVHLDIYDEELEAVVKLIACMTGKNIILAKSLKGKKITIYSPRLVTANEAYRAFLTGLEANGFTISRQGKFLRIIDIKNASRYPDPILDDEVTPPVEDRMVTQIIHLKNVDAAEINEVLSRLATNNAQFIVYAPTNSLIITETASNLRKLRKLIQEFDIEGGQEQLWVYQVVNAEAQEIAQKINEIFEADAKAGKSRSKVKKAKKGRRGKGRTAPKSSSVGQSELDVRASKVIADERTNRLFIVATARSYRSIKSLIRKLDISIEGEGQVHIHQLNHAKAVDLANVLSNLSQEQRGRGSSKRKSTKKRSKSKRKKSSSRSSKGSGSAALFEGEVSVTADEDTNALVITASLKDYLALKQVIEILDRARRQVFIEAIVMEVSIRNNRQFGISLHGGLPDETAMGESMPVLLGSQTALTSSWDLTSAATLQGLAAAAFTPDKTFSFAGQDIPAFGVVLNALARSSDVNILSTPHILTTDNEEAEIVVGSNVPFVSSMMSGGFGGAAGGMGGGFFPTVNIQRTDVALTLKITPRINAANHVTLEIDQKIEEIEGMDERLGPTTSKRSIKSVVVVKDQHTVVIGGLQKSRHLNARTGVPILGEIPLLGHLFRSNSKEHERRNLLLLLTPHVIESQSDFSAIFERKMDEHREFMARFHKEGDQIVLGVDYGKKHGLLEAIHKSLEEAREEERFLEELRNQDKGPPLPQEIDGLEAFEEPNEDLPEAKP